MRPFGCLVIILNTIDHLGKFNGKADEGFFVGYSLNTKAFRVLNSRTRIVEENLHFRFNESTPNVAGSTPDWLFDIDALTRTMNYEPITADPPFSQNPKCYDDDGFKPSSDVEKNVNEDPRKESECNDQEKKDNVNSTNNVNIVSSTVNVVGTNKDNTELPVDPNMPTLEDYSIFDFLSDDQEDGTEADMNNLDTTIQVSPIPTIRIHKDHPLNQVIGDLQSATQTRNMSKNLEEYGFVSTTLKQRRNHKDLQNCLFACFLSQEEPKKTLVELPNGKRAIGTKWVFKNKKDERGIMIRNKTRLVAQRYTQEKGIDYDEVFSPVARIKAIRLFLAYALFKDFVVYQMDVKSVFLYGKIEEEVYVYQPLGFKDLDFPDRVYKVEKSLYGPHQAPRAWYETLSTYLLDNGFQRGKIDKTLFIKRYKDPKSSHDDGSKPSSDNGKKVDEDPRKESELSHALEKYRDYEDNGAEADMNNLDTTIQVSPIPTTRIHKDHPLDQVIRDLQSATQTRRMSKKLEEHGFVEPKRKDCYDEDFAPVARIEAITLFLAYASFKDFVVYQMDVKNAFLYGKIIEVVYVCQPPGFEDPDFPIEGFKDGKIGQGTLFIKRYKGDVLLQKKDGIFISQDKYVGEILKKFRFTEVKTASTPMETQKTLLKDEDGEEVHVHMYRSMIGSLMYLTSSRPDIIFVVYACARYQVNPKVLHLHAVKRIFRYLKGQLKLGLWYPKDSPFDLVAYTDSDYARASLDRKSV
ncbi:putative ribonuclease H-like domain-containing protein, partial [Tanacetum coccineum]